MQLISRICDAVVHIEMNYVIQLVNVFEQFFDAHLKRSC